MCAPTTKSLQVLPLNHIQRAIHAFFAEVNEQALHLMMYHPECGTEAQRVVREGNLLLRKHIGNLQSQKWNEDPDTAALKQICNEAQTDSLQLLRRIQEAAVKSNEFS